LQTRTVVGPVSATQSLSDVEISYDDNTDSHWAVAYEFRASLGPVYAARIARVGHSGGVVETATLHTSNVAGDTDPGVTSHTFTAGLTTSSRFLAVHAGPGLGAPVYGQAFVYDPAATSVLVGTACGGLISADPPYAGDEFFSVRFTAGPSVYTSAILLLSNAQGNLSLAGIGMPGCFLNVEPSFFLSFATVVNAGSGSVRLSLPDAPVFLGNAYFQWIWVSPGANAANLLATHGLMSSVR